MNFKDLMAADMVKVFTNSSDFAESVAYAPAANVTTFACTLTPSDPEEQFVDASSGVGDQRRAQFFGALAVLRTAIGVIEGTARDPARGDLLTVSSGPYAGTWVVERVAADIGGGIAMHARLETRYSAGVAGVTPRS